MGKVNPGAKAALLSGPPGIGKSTTAALVAKMEGYEVFELNASDARSKKTISKALQDVVGSQVLSFGGASSSARASRPKKRLIVMDEVDGMSSADRGGMRLIKLIKASKTPIVCICNERMKSNVRTLANHCYDLRFQRPTRPAL